VLCHAFRRGDLPEFFATAHPGPREQPKKSRAHPGGAGAEGAYRP
jgi:hypothetical protein